MTPSPATAFPLPEKPINSKDKRDLTIKYGATEFFYWFSLAAANYLTVFLNALGFNVQQVSIINTINSGVSIISTPLWGTIADKLRSSRKALIICLIGFGLSYALIPLTSGIKIAGFSLMLIFIVVSQSFRAPSWPLLDSTVISGCSQNGVFYGLVRSMGSISFVIMNFTLSLILTDSSSFVTFYILSALLIPTIIVLMSLRSAQGDSLLKKSASLKEMHFGKLFKNPYFIAYIIFSIGQFIPQVCMNTYQPYLVKDIVGSMSSIGYIQAYRALFEVPTLLLSRRLHTKISFKQMVVIAGVLHAVQAVMSCYVTSFFGLMAITTLAGIASGFTHAGAAQYVFTVSAKEFRATAQTVAGSMQYAAGIIGNFLGGVMITSIGLRNFYLSTGLMIAASLAFFLLSFVFIKKVMHVPYVDQSADQVLV